MDQLKEVLEQEQAVCSLYLVLTLYCCTWRNVANSLVWADLLF